MPIITDNANGSAPVRATGALDERVAVTFAKRAGAQITHWIELTYPVDARPDALLSDLAEIGWAETLSPLIPMPAYRRDDEGKLVNLGYMESEIHLGVTGSGLFGTWTAEDKKSHLAAARKIMRRHGLVNVPVWCKTLADML